MQILHGEAGMSSSLLLLLLLLVLPTWYADTM
jgi:hypothetical protein